MKRVAIACLIALSAPAAAQDVSPPIAVSASSLDPALPVTDGDISDRRYVVIGPIQTGVRKNGAFGKEPGQAKIYKELWERGKKMGADAVILAAWGKSHITAMSWGSTMASGKAIKWADGGR